MAYAMRDNTGSLWKNDRRENDSHPNAKGKAMIGGVWYWVSAWTKDGKQPGTKFQSLQFEMMTEEQVNKYCSEGGGRQQQAAPRQQQRPQQARPQQLPSGGGQLAGAVTENIRNKQQANGPPFGNEQHFEESEIPF